MKTWLLAGVAASVAAAAWAQAPAPAAVPAPPWQTTVSAGANVTRGNSETAPGKDQNDVTLIAGLSYKL